MNDLFARFSRKASDLAGRPATFIAACALILVWAASGPWYDWSDSHSLVVNTITTVVTFLLVFLIQSSQNTDTRAINLKLDELIRALDQADSRLIDIEHDTDAQVEALRQSVKAQKES